MQCDAGPGADRDEREPGAGAHRPLLPHLLPPRHALPDCRHDHPQMDKS